jgi:hypothetical protein
MLTLRGGFCASGSSGGGLATPAICSAALARVPMAPPAQPACSRASSSSAVARARQKEASDGMGLLCKGRVEIKVLQSFKRMHWRPACVGAKSACNQRSSCARSAFMQQHLAVMWNFFFAD